MNCPSSMVFGAFFLVVIVLGGCVSKAAFATPFPSPTPSPSASVAPDCHTDADCILRYQIADCSGYLCMAKKTPFLQPPMIKSCPFQPENVCYQSSGCICQTGRCAWSPSTVQCVQNMTAPDPRPAESLCKGLCTLQKAYGQDLSNGPCLSNRIVSDWVCDVAHNPRQPVDDLPQNQCSSYGTTARHFVEVDENCNVIRTG